MTDDRRDEEQQETRPQAPVVIIGRQARFLDVQRSVDEAEGHLARHQEGPSHECLPRALPLDACDYYDGVVRQLQPVVHDDGTVTLELAPGDPHPERLRARVNELLLWALETYDLASLVAMSTVGEDKIDERELKDLLTPPADESFPRFLDALDQRFNPQVNINHLAGRLHNLWHALGG
jgi:hypothetical protein